ncbi:MAG: hypothetical protein KBD25_00470 [Rickettsiaceae bacterium]|nr:hypothetical protein [Rickettsiaceae bacterium]
MRKKITTLSLAVTLVINLTGCETMNSGYDCPLKGSASCESLHDMDSRISNGSYYIEGVSNAPKFNNIGELGLKKDSFEKIWIAPRVDSEGNQHDQRYVYVTAASVNNS